MSASASASSRVPSRPPTLSMGSNATDGSSSGGGRRIDEPLGTTEKLGALSAGERRRRVYYRRWYYEMTFRSK